MCEVKVYIAKTDALEEDHLFEALYKQVSPRRREKIDRYQNRQDKNLSLAAEHLLFYAAKDFGLDNILIKEDENGKPYIENSDVYFNLSHSGERVMCAMGRHKVGCDVQKIKPVDTKLAQRFFAKDEYETIMSEQNESDRTKRLVRLWTLKESFSKAVGLGLKMPLNSFCIELSNDVKVLQNVSQKDYYFKEYDLHDGYYYAVCSTAKQMGELKIVDIKKRL